MPMMPTTFKDDNYFTCPKCGPQDTMLFDASALEERLFEGLWFEITPIPGGLVCVDHQRKDDHYLKKFDMAEYHAIAADLLTTGEEPRYCPTCKEDIPLMEKAQDVWSRAQAEKKAGGAPMGPLSGAMICRVLGEELKKDDWGDIDPIWIELAGDGDVNGSPSNAINAGQFLEVADRVAARLNRVIELQPKKD